jgi:NarL family two-component system response regulator LiaR
VRAGFDTCDLAANADKARYLAMSNQPDVVLMDVNLPTISGIEAAKVIKERLPGCRIIIFTSDELEEVAIAAVEAKCDGYCLKGIDVLQLCTAILAVMDGGMWLDPSIARKLIDAYVGQALPTLKASVPSSNVVRDSLSERELEVLNCVVDGLSNNEIAAKLFLSPQTVKTHLSHIMEKLSASDRTQAAVKALRGGLI